MLSDSMTLRQFFEAHYLPTKIENPSGRNVDSYRRALTWWELLTSNPPLSAITSATLSDFKAALSLATYSRRKDNGNQNPLAINTQAKILDHCQWILDAAGPRGPRSRRSAAGLLAEAPYTRPPKRRRRYRPMLAEASIVAFWEATSEARVPIVDGCEPAAIWRALIATICSTSLRIGQLNATPMASLHLPQRLLILPDSICQKSKTEEPHPLHSLAVRELLAIRGERRRLFPLWKLRPTDTDTRHSKNTIYAEAHRLQRLAGVDPFGFHDLRAAVLTKLSAISPAAAQLAAGHSAYATTQLYQRVELLTEAVDQLDLLNHRFA